MSPGRLLDMIPVHKMGGHSSKYVILQRSKLLGYDVTETFPDPYCRYQVL